MNDFIPTQTMLNNYIQNKLSEPEIEQLELWLVDHPDVMEDLEMGGMFKQADFDPNVIPETVKTNKRSWLETLMPKPALVFSHAAVFALGMFLFNQFINDTNTNSVATFIELEKQRGLDKSIIEVETSNYQSLVVRFFPDSMTGQYSFVMKSKSNDNELVFNDLQVDDYGSITITLNTVNMIGEWEILISNLTSLEQSYKLLINDR